MLQDATQDATQDAHAEPVAIEPRSSVADLRRLNRERWERQLAQEEPSTGMAVPAPAEGAVAAPPPAPAEPTDARLVWVLGGGRRLCVGDVRFAPVQSEDGACIIPESSVYKRKVSCGCFGKSLTAAQWIWALNLVCFLAHTFMAIFTLERAYWRWDRSMWTDTEHMKVTIYRISQVPTLQQYLNNESFWSPGRNDTSGRAIGGNEHWLRDNGLSVNFASLTAAFFGISALFHLWAVVVGATPRWWHLYWRRLDNAYAPWRWLEYSMSASLMALSIAISTGLREQNILSGIFMLHFVTMLFGLLTEVYSRPKLLVEDGRRLISQEEWQTTRPLYDARNTNTVVATEPISGRRGGVWAWKQHYIQRMLPHAIGWFPMTAAWVLIIAHLEFARHDLKQITDVSIPVFILAAIYGSILLFWCFTIVQAWYQALPPTRYWESEIWYCILSLTAKLYLGFILLINVIGVDGSVEEALAGQ